MGEILNLERGLAQLRPAAPLSQPRPPARPASFDALALLLAETAAGREAAFARLYELTAGRLFAIARGIVGGRSDVAQDVLQEAFLRVWRSAHRFDPDKGKAYAWLVRIVRNRALSVRETLHRREEGHDEIQADALAALEADPAEQAMLSEDARRVRGCLARLPANHRRALTLVYFAGLTHGELADCLAVPSGTAKSWVRRGLAAMSRCLCDGDDDWRSRVAADYAVGGLQGPARRGFDKRRARDARYCAAVDRWEDRFALLTEALPPAPPPAHVWRSIEQRIAGERVSFSRPLLWQVATAVLALAVILLASVLLLR
jgi:RNA polymerase sigma-70 factor (ECF subfamily)